MVILLMKGMIMATLREISGWVWGGLACVVALIFVFIVPNEKAVLATSGLHFFVLRWFHSLVWVFLALSLFMRASRNQSLIKFANPVAMLGGICYAVYLVSFLQLPSTP
jgi:hypothetical protein